MACGGSPAEDFPDKVMPRAAPCTCSKKCRGRSGSVVFLGLFLLSLCLHAVTLVCYLDLRSEVKREIIHQKRDSMLTLAGSDLADPAAVLSPGHPRLDPGGGSGSRGGEGHEVKKKKKEIEKEKKRKALFSFLTWRLFVFIHLRAVLLFPYHGVRFCVCVLLRHVFWATSSTVACHEVLPAQFPDKYISAPVRAWFRLFSRRGGDALEKV